ncbi:hypothetical protein [Reichenbachiella faecimaris]|nr:hypothetical protein [Reichenbachiella faecimaris]
MNQSRLKLLFFFVFIFFSSCDDNETLPPQLDNEKFLRSFHRVIYRIVGYQSPTYEGEFRHEYDDKGRLIRSSRNIQYLGEIGEEVEVFEHSVSDDGFISSSVSISYDESSRRDYPIYYLFNYDKDGLIEKVKISTDYGQISDLTIRHNSEGLVERIEEKNEYWVENHFFFYDEDKNTIKIRTESEGSYFEAFFEYQEELLTKYSTSFNGELNSYYYTFEYDSKNVLIKRNNFSDHGDSFTRFEYGDYYRELLFKDDKIQKESVYGNKLKLRMLYDYQYNYYPSEYFEGEINFCYLIKWTDDSLLEHTFYEISNGELLKVGHGTTKYFQYGEENHQLGDTGVSIVKFYDATSELIYTAEISWIWSSEYSVLGDGKVVEKIIWKDKSDELIEYSNIQEGWVKFLFIRLNDAETLD